MLQAFLSAVVLGFAIGGLARWAVPGPDPMPAWLTIFIGLTGSLVGGGSRPRSSARRPAATSS